VSVICWPNVSPIGGTKITTRWIEWPAITTYTAALLVERADRADLRHFLRVARRHRWLLLSIVVLLPLITYLVSSQLSKTYEAKTTLFVQATSVTSPQFQDQASVSTSSPEDVARLVKTPLVANVAAKNLGIPRSQARSLLRKVSAQLEISSDSSSTTNSDFLTIRARDHDPDRSAEIATAFADAVAAKRSQQAISAIDRTIADLNQEAPVISQLSETAKSDLATEIQDLRTLRASQESATQIVDPVVTPSGPISPKPGRNTALAFIFGLLLAAALVPVLDRLENRLRESEDVERAAGARLLGMIPENAFPGRVPTASVRESFQMLRASLTSFNVDETLTRVMIASAGNAEGKTTVATNLAIALAQDERDVILVDGDLRRRQAAPRFGIDAELGLDAVLLEKRDVSDALVDVEDVEGGRLRLLPVVSPPANPSVLLGSKRMRTVLDELSSMCDMVIIDTPPLLAVSDAIPLIDVVSGVILVARLDQTTRHALIKTAEVIGTAGGTTLGVVATATRRAGLYGYESYAYYGATPEDPSRTLATGTGGNGRWSLDRLLRRNGKSDAVKPPPLPPPAEPPAKPPSAESASAANRRKAPERRKRAARSKSD
jgi:capsular exopolysaccharide synthesis family protein